MFVVIMTIAIIVLVFSIYHCCNEGFDKLRQQQKDKKMKVTLIVTTVILVCSLVAIYITAFNYECNKVTEIIPIKEIYLADNGDYIVVDDDMRLLGIDTNDVRTGDDNYIIYTYTLSIIDDTDFLTFAKRDDYAIVLKDTNVPKISQLKK